MAKSLYERRRAHDQKIVPPATYRQLEKVVLKSAEKFCEEWFQTDGWSRKCERKALLLNMAVENLLSKKPDSTAEGKTGR